MLPPGFWLKVAKTETCWLWRGALSPEGYGRVGRHGYAHRLSHEHHNGAVPAGLFVCHRCDVRNCVRPEHLFVGTQGDNNRDMFAKGRAGCHARPETVRRGTAINTVKLTEATVLAIRRERAAGATCTALAAKHGVTKENVSQIVRGKTWRHVREGGC